MSELPPTQALNWPPKAYKNKDFLDSAAARDIRVLCELREPAARFDAHRVQDTLVLFGSARTLHPDDASTRLEAAEARCAATAEPSPEDRRALAAARIAVKSAPYYKATMEIAKRLTEWSLSLKDRRFLICSGGGPGIMEAANRGAMEAGGESVGFGISLPFEQGINEYVTREFQFEFHYFFVRKYWFMLMAKALITFPGGFGTLDELFESLTLIQTRKVRKPMPIVLFGGEFWNDLINFDTLIEWGTISAEDVELFRVMDSVEETCDFVIAELEKNWL